MAGSKVRNMSEGERERGTLSIKNLRTIRSNQHPKNGPSTCQSSPLILFIDKFALTRSLVTFSWELTFDILIYRTSFETVFTSGYFEGWNGDHIDSQI